MENIKRLVSDSQVKNYRFLTVFLILSLICLSFGWYFGLANNRNIFYYLLFLDLGFLSLLVALLFYTFLEEFEQEIKGNNNDKKYFFEIKEKDEEMKAKDFFKDLSGDDSFTMILFMISISMLFILFFKGFFIISFKLSLLNFFIFWVIFIGLLKLFIPLIRWKYLKALKKERNKIREKEA